MDPRTEQERREEIMRMYEAARQAYEATRLAETKEMIMDAISARSEPEGLPQP